MDKVRVKVVGPCEVAGVKRPGTVDLDPSRVNVRALVRAGHVELLADQKKTETEKKS